MMWKSVVLVQWSESGHIEVESKCRFIGYSYKLTDNEHWKNLDKQMTFNGVLRSIERNFFPG